MAVTRRMRPKPLLPPKSVFHAYRSLIGSILKDSNGSLGLLGQVVGERPLFAHCSHPIGEVSDQLSNRRRLLPKRRPARSASFAPRVAPGFLREAPRRWLRGWIFPRWRRGEAFLADCCFCRVKPTSDLCLERVPRIPDSFSQSASFDPAHFGLHIWLGSILRTMSVWVCSNAQLKRLAGRRP